MHSPPRLCALTQAISRGRKAAVSRAGRPQASRWTLHASGSTCVTGRKTPSSGLSQGPHKLSHKCQLVLLEFSGTNHLYTPTAQPGTPDGLHLRPQGWNSGQWQQDGRGVQLGWQQTCRVGSSPRAIWLGPKVMAASNWALSSSSCFIACSTSGANSSTLSRRL